MKKTILLLLIAVFTACNNPVKAPSGGRVEEIDLGSNVIQKIDTAALILKRMNEMKKDSLKLFTTNFANISLNHEMSEAIDYLEGRTIWDWIISEDQDIFKGNKTCERLSRKIINKSNSILASVLPSYRKSFAKNLANTLWERDIYVTSSGTGNTVLNMTGGIFAANANIKDFQKIIQENAKHYGFKQVRYRWYKDASEYTRYDID